MIFFFGIMMFFFDMSGILLLVTLALAAALSFSFVVLMSMRFCTAALAFIAFIAFFIAFMARTMVGWRLGGSELDSMWRPVAACGTEVQVPLETGCGFGGLQGGGLGAES